MKNRYLQIILGLVLIGILVLVGCGGDETTTTSTTTQPTSTQTTATTSTTAPIVTTTATATPSPTTGPVSGGTLRMIAAAVPKVLGYAAEKVASDNYLMLPVLEPLTYWGDTAGNLVGGLAESWEMDGTAKTITWHLREGIKFHDGTDFDAEALRWNFQLSKDTASGAGSQFILSMEVKDKYTLVKTMDRLDWQMLMNYGLIRPISPTAFDTAGGTIPAGSDFEASKEWARTNAVGTGPFTVGSWTRDDQITFVKNPSYWREGQPYLDSIEIRMIPQAMVAAASLQAGEADVWMETSSVTDIVTLQDDYKINWGPGMFNLLMFNSADETNPLSNKLVREAIEYALDREAMAASLGQGIYEPLHQMASNTWPGYVTGYNPRPYNVDKAKELLAEAGYPNGLTMKVMATETSTDAMALLIYYLGEAGITVEPDTADLGRYFGAAFSNGWDDILLSASGINPDATDLFVHFGPNPQTFRPTCIWKSEEFKAFCDEALNPNFQGAADAMPSIRNAIKQAGEDAIFVPLWRSANACIMQQYVHTDYLKIHGITWEPHLDWMEKH